LDVDRALLRGAAELLGGPLDAVGEEVAEAFAAAHHPEQALRALDVAPLELEAELLPGDVALLLALHDPAAEPAPLVDVDARLVALGVEPRDAVALRRAARPPAAGQALVLGLADNLPLLRALPDDRHVAVVHAAGVALMAAMIEVLAELRCLPDAHVGAGDVGRQVGRVVLDGQGAHLREVHDAGQRAVLVERARRRVGLEVMGHLLRRLHHAAGIGGGDRLRPLHDRDRLEPLLAHDGAAAVLGGDVTEVALNGGEAHEVLAGRADRVDRELVADQAGLPVERVLRLPRVQPEQRLGVAQLDDVVVDVEIDPALRLPLDDDRVVTAIFQIRAEESVGLGRGGTVGAGPDGADGEAARAPHRQAGGRAPRDRRAGRPAPHPAGRAEAPPPGRAGSRDGPRSRCPCRPSSPSRDTGSSRRDRRRRAARAASRATTARPGTCGARDRRAAGCRRSRPGAGSSRRSSWGAGTRSRLWDSYGYRSLPGRLRWAPQNGFGKQGARGLGRNEGRLDVERIRLQMSLPASEPDAGLDEP